MMRWVIKIVGMTLLFGLLTVQFVFAQEEKPVMRLTLNECITEAFEHNLSLQIAVLDLQDIELELAKMQLEEKSRIPRLEMEGKEKAVITAQERLQETRRKVAEEVESKYYQVLQATQILKMKKRSLAWVEKQLEVAKIKYTSGLLAAKDMELLVERLKEGEKDYAISCFTLETMYMDLKITLGWELESTFYLANEEFPYIPLEVDLATTIANAQKFSAGVRQAQAKLGEAEENLRLKKVTKASKVELMIADHALTRAVLQLKEAEKTAVITGRSAYLSILAGNDRVVAAEKAYITVQRDLAVLKIKYDAGLVALNELLQANQKLDEAENNWIQAIYEYNQAKANYNQTIGTYKGSDMHE